MTHPFDQTLPTTGVGHARRLLKRRHYGILFLAVVAAAITGWWMAGTRVIDLGADNNLIESGLYQQWAKGNVVVLIRHAERCDRSVTPCLGTPDGITVNGSRVAASVGAGLRKLGLDNTRVIASPLTRTQQTADLMAGRAVSSEPWLGQCDSGFKQAVQTHKSEGSNLVLVTHSGCIDHFERQMGVPPGDRSSAYAEAFFVEMDGLRTPKILGSLNAQQWKALDAGRAQ